MYKSFSPYLVDGIKPMAMRPNEQTQVRLQSVVGKRTKKTNMNIKELREEISSNFMKETSHTKRLNKAYEVLDGIDHKRPFVYVCKGLNHVEALQLPKNITSQSLDELIEKSERQKDGQWYYYDGKTLPVRIEYESIHQSFINIRKKYYG